MAKYSITDARWVGDAVGGTVFLVITVIVLYVWATSMRPIPNRLASAVMYYAVLCALVGTVGAICVKGFTCRRIEVGNEGLVIHEGYYGIFWKITALPKSQITAVDDFDSSRRGMFTRVPTSGIRASLAKGITIVLVESDGAGKYRKEAIQVRNALGLGENEGS